MYSTGLSGLETLAELTLGGCHTVAVQCVSRVSLHLDADACLAAATPTVSAGAA
jgi:hypothetical protein